jgi:hypothetical protein
MRITKTIKYHNGLLKRKKKHQAVTAGLAQLRAEIVIKTLKFFITLSAV